jgi:hypothetical protein
MTTIILTLLLLPPVGGLGNTDVSEAALSTTDVAAAQQTGTRDVEAKKSAVPTIPGFATDVKIDIQPVVLALAAEDNAAVGTEVGTEDGTGLTANFPETPPAKENVVASATSPFWLAGAEPHFSSFSTDTSGLFIIAGSPVKVETHRFFDRANLIGTAIHAAVRTVDAVQTCALLSRGAREAWLPMKGCPAIAAYSLSMVPAQIGNSYLLHRSGHHKLEKWMPYLWAAPSAAGIGVSMRAW